jgi:hypothetical protein
MAAGTCGLFAVAVGLGAVLATAGDADAGPIDIDLPVKPLYQNDYTDRLDNSATTIDKDGCTLTAWTMAFNHAISGAGLHGKAGDKAGPLITYTPADINRLMNDYRYEQKTYKKGPDGKPIREGGKLVVEKVETKNGWGLTIGPDGKPIGAATDINLGSLFKAVEKDTKARSFEGKGLTQERFFSDGWGDAAEIGKGGLVVDTTFLKLLEQLENGVPVVVRVFNDNHSVLVSSYHAKDGAARGAGRYDIKDPWKPAGIEWLDHEDYKNTIYSWGAGVFKAGGVHVPFEVPSDFFIDPVLLTDPEANPDAFGLQFFVEVPAHHAHVPAPATLMCLLGSLVLTCSSRTILRTSCIRRWARSTSDTSRH